MGQKHSAVLVSERIGHLDAAQEPALIVADERNIGPVALHQGNSFLAHPFGHKHVNRVTECTADRRERNSCVAACCFGNDIAFSNGPVTVRRGQDMERHSVLDAAGEIEMFSLNEDRPTLTIKVKMYREQGSVADQVLDIRRTRRAGGKMALKIAESVGIHRGKPS